MSERERRSISPWSPRVDLPGGRKGACGEACVLLVLEDVSGGGRAWLPCMPLPKSFSPACVELLFFLFFFSPFLSWICWRGPERRSASLCFEGHGRVLLSAWFSPPPERSDSASLKLGPSLPFCVGFIIFPLPGVPRKGTPDLERLHQACGLDHPCRTCRHAYFLPHPRGVCKEMLA